MTNVVNTNPYKPNQLKILSLGVGISDDTNDTLNLTDTQHLIVAERRENVNGNIVNTYGLIVDREGISVNTTREDRAYRKGQYAMYVDGSVFVTGAIIACNIISDNGEAGGGFSHMSSNFWVMGTRETDNIFYPGHVTLGADTSSRSNQHTFNIVQSADRNINHAQISLQNTALSQLRIGILGTSNLSPVVFNTRPGVPIEFHMSRDKDYFDARYTRSYWEGGQSNTVPSETPGYPSRELAPHVLIDAKGDVGIRTSVVPRYNFELRLPNPNKPSEIQFPPVTQNMNLAVAGNFFASNILMWDYEGGEPANIDRLFVRRKGITMEANQIIPGSFAMGDYTFVSNVSINGPTENDFELKIHGDQRITNRLVVDQIAKVGLLEATDAILLDVASFCNDVYMNRDVIVKESLRLRGGLFTQIAIGSNTFWCNVQFTVANHDYSSINFQADGFNTPGRLGVGIDPMNDEVNHQLVVRKRFSDIYELELQDRSATKLYRAAFIGHPILDGSRITDGSLVFATPGAKDADYNRGYAGDAPQNFYFFPGYYTRFAEPIVRDGNPPVLNVYHKKRVGIMTYDPDYELDVKGSVNFTSNMYYDNIKVGLWLEKTYPNIYTSGGSSPTFVGIELYNNRTSNVGLNVPPDPRYGMVVAGKIKSMDGFYSADDQRIVPWYDSVSAENIIAPQPVQRMFALSHVGIGIRNPSTCLELKNYYANYTSLRFYRPEGGDVEPISTIEFHGILPQNPWIIRHHDDLRTLEFGYGSNAFANNASTRALWMQNNINNKPQVVIGGNLNTLQNTNHPNTDATLTVDGSLAVLGDVNITGRYMINGSILVNSNIQGSNTINLTNDDVLVAGRRVLINPSKMMAVGYTSLRLSHPSEDSDKSPFRVFQSDPSAANIARFTCQGNNGYLEIASIQTDQSVKLGFFNNRQGFSILNSRDVPFLSFTSNEVNGENYLSINNSTAPTANVHIQTRHLGCNMLRLTRYIAGDDASAFAPEIELEKRVTNNAGLDIRRWIIRAPDASFDQKLSLRYGEDVNGQSYSGSSTELFCFTRTGCIGIGNTNPEFALDVSATGKKGSLRLYNSTNEPVPQLLFQSGGSKIFGQDESTDYRLYSHSNTFTLDSINTTEYKRLLHFTSNGNLGILSDPSSNYTVNIGGTLNVSRTIYLDGTPLFDTDESASSQEGFSIRAVNIYMRPRPEFGGGIHINRGTPSSNLFHIGAGWNANLAVFDSSFNEAQIHFRASDGTSSDRFSIYRVSQSNQTFMLEHFPNTSNEGYVSSEHKGYSNVFAFNPSSIRSNEYNMSLYGSMHMIATEPVIRLSSGEFGYSNGNMYMIAQNTSLQRRNIGIGTTAPIASLHLFSANSTTTPAFIVNQVNNGNIMELRTPTTTQMVFTNQGNMGVGTTSLQGRVHVHGGDLFVSNGATRSPSYFFTGTSALSSISSSNNIVSITTNNQERIRINETGNVGIGTTTNLTAALAVQSSNNTVGCRIVQSGTGSILRLTNQVGNTVLDVGSTLDIAMTVLGDLLLQGNVYPPVTEVFTLGTPTNRWKDIFLSGNTIDLGGTQISRSNNGDLKLLDETSSNLRGIAVKEVQLGGDAYHPQAITIRPGVSNNPIVFVSKTAEGSNVEYAPFISSVDSSGNASGIQIGIDNPEALVHINNVYSYATAIFDRTTDVSLASNAIFEVRENGDHIFSVQRHGNVGIGTTYAVTPFHVFSSNHTSAMTVQQIDPYGSTASFKSTLQTVVIDGKGNLGIGTTSPMYSLHTYGTQKAEGVALFAENVYAMKNVEVQGDNIVHGDQTTDSDIRLKHDLQRITGALEKVSMLTGYTFEKTNNVRRSTGLVAQEVQKVIPEAVISHGDNEYLSVAYGNMMGLIVEAIKELREEVEHIKKCLN